MRKLLFIFIIGCVCMGCGLDQPGIADPHAQTPDTGVNEPDGSSGPVMGACCTEKNQHGMCIQMSKKDCGTRPFIQGEACTEINVRACQTFASVPDEDESVSCCTEDRYCVHASSADKCSGTSFSTVKDCREACTRDIVSCCLDNQCQQMNVSRCINQGGDPHDNKKSCAANCKKERPPVKGACCTNISEGVCKQTTKGQCQSGFFHKGQSCSSEEVNCKPDERLTSCCTQRSDTHTLACHTFSFSTCLEKGGTPHESMNSCTYKKCQGEEMDVVCGLKGKCRPMTSVEQCRKLGGEAYLNNRDCRRAYFTHACCFSKSCRGDLLPSECREVGGFPHSGGERGVGCTAGVERQCRMFTTTGACCEEGSCRKSTEWGCHKGDKTFHEGEDCNDITCGN